MLRLRKSLALALSAAALAPALVSSFWGPHTTEQQCQASSVASPTLASSASPSSRYVQPAVFVPHGGGPLPILGDPSHKSMVQWLEHFQRDFVRTRPDAIVLVTAHWEEDVTTITSSAAPELNYDYYGFPDEAYDIKYPTPGSPTLASRIQDLLANRSIPSKLDDKRGFDHGVFIP